MRLGNRDGEGECYQVNSSLKVVYNDKSSSLDSISVNGEPVEDDKLYTAALQGYHFNNSKDYLGISNEELLESGKHKVITTSAQEVLEEFLRNNQNISKKIEGRLIYK
jgi:5'-nucleotidase